MRFIVRSSGPRMASTMQNSVAPRAAVSLAAAMTSAVSRNGVACTGDSKLADWLQKWQSSGQPPVLAERMPSTSTVSPHHSSRTSWARAARAGTEESGTSERATSSSAVSWRRSSSSATWAARMAARASSGESRGRSGASARGFGERATGTSGMGGKGRRPLRRSAKAALPPSPLVGSAPAAARPGPPRGCLRPSPGRGRRAAGRTASMSTPARVSSHEVTEFEFHMSPRASSWRPHTAVGTEGVSVEQPPRPVGVVDHPHRAVDRGGRIGDRPAGPAPDLVAEDPEPPEQPATRRRPRPRRPARRRRQGSGATSMTWRPSGTTTSSAEW